MSYDDVSSSDDDVPVKRRLASDLSASAPAKKRREEVSVKNTFAGVSEERCKLKASRTAKVREEKALDAEMRRKAMDRAGVRNPRPASFPSLNKRVKPKAVPKLIPTPPAQVPRPVVPAPVAPVDAGKSVSKSINMLVFTLSYNTGKILLSFFQQIVDVGSEFLQITVSKEGLIKQASKEARAAKKAAADAKKAAETGGASTSNKVDASSKDVIACRNFGVSFFLFLMGTHLNFLILFWSFFFCSTKCRTEMPQEGRWPIYVCTVVDSFQTVITSLPTEIRSKCQG